MAQKFVSKWLTFWLTFTDNELTVGEIKLWIKTIDEKGPFKAPFPVLNGFADTIVQTGILGLLLFIAPIVWIFVKTCKIPNLFFRLDFICYFTAYIGVIVAMLSNGASIPYYFLTAILTVFIQKHIRTQAKEEKCNDGI